MGLFDWLVRVFTGAPRPPRDSAWRNGSPADPGRESAENGATPVDQSTSTQSSSPRKSSLAGLDLGELAPATSDEVRDGVGQLGSLWGNPWFGRRDLIPPLSDKRTELIDRGMLGQGLISSAELEEIHRIGEEMDRIRPDLALARTQAAAAVSRSQAEREQIKQQKKAEAEERKRQRAEAVAQRRQSDIIYLGRGVSKGLADRRANVERLTSLGLPVLATPGDVAAAMQIEIRHLRWLSFYTEAATRTHYFTFDVPKRSGGVRQLAAPHTRLRIAQEWILENVLRCVPPHDAAHGFVPGRSTLTNAAGHVGCDVVLNADLCDFFPTITFSRVKGVFSSLGYSPAVATIFALLCTESPRRKMKYAGVQYEVATAPPALPQGACTSPALSDLVARRLDRRLSGLAAALGWNYTRYADDLTLSASGEAAGKLAYVMARLRHIADDEGFSINEKKTRVQRPHTRQSVTGVVVNQRPGAPRPVVRRLRAILHQAKYEGLAAQNREDIPHFESWLAGMIAYVTMLNPQQGEPLQAAFDAVCE